MRKEGDKLGGGEGGNPNEEGGAAKKADKAKAEKEVSRLPPTSYKLQATRNLVVDRCRDIC